VGHLSLVHTFTPKKCRTQILVLCERNCGQREIEDLLSPGDYQLNFADRPCDAFEILGQKPIHLIVSGVHQEESNSYEFLNRVKASPNWKEIPFVFLSLKRSQLANHVDHALALAAKALGATKYVSVDALSAAEIQAEIARCLTITA
jgi:CheY-like chemotaxis protein